MRAFFFDEITRISKKRNYVISLDEVSFLTNLLINPPIPTINIANNWFKGDFKTIGESTLFTLGFYPQSIKKGLLSANYLAHMGALSYAQLNNPLLDKVSRNYRTLIYILNELNLEHHGLNQEMVFSLYQDLKSPFFLSLLKK